jgi:spore germination protein KC
MKWTKILSIILLIPFLFLGGCWDLKTIERVYYIDVMGFDYRDGEYHLYSKITDFSLLSKSETAAPSAIAMNWIGHGKGKTLHEAFFQLYSASEQILSYAQLHGMIFTERALEKGVINEVIDIFGRFHQARPTQWVFATSEPIEKVLIIPPELFIPKRSQTPLNAYNQNSSIRPVHMHEVLSRLYEAGTTLLIPRIKIAKLWTDEKKPVETIQLSGVYSMHKQKKISSYSEQQLAGLRWITPQTNRALLILKEGKQVVASIIFVDPKVKIESSIQNGKPYFDIDVSVTGQIYMIRKPLQVSRIYQLSEKAIEEEIRSTFLEGVTRKDDLYSLSKVLLNQHHALWHKLNEEKAFFLEKNSLRSVHAKVTISNSGGLKLRDSNEIKPQIQY